MFLSESLLHGKQVLIAKVGMNPVLSPALPSLYLLFRFLEGCYRAPTHKIPPRKLIHFFKIPSLKQLLFHDQLQHMTSLFLAMLYLILTFLI